MSKQLLALNVNEHTERKGNLTYLSWAWAWAEVLKHDEEADWDFEEFAQPDGTVSPCMYIGQTAMVKTWVKINGRTRRCMLPVMDHKNKAIPNPDAFAVNTAIMRCMTKAISMHGLGLYIYAGEDLPQLEAEPTPEELAERERQEKRAAELEELAYTMVEFHRNGKTLDAIALWYNPDSFASKSEDKQQEQLHVWNLLKTESSLRSAIKANKPEQ